MIGDEDAQTPFELLRDQNLRNEMGGLLEVLDNQERKSSLSVSVLTVESRKLWKTSVKISALRGSVFGNCRTLRWPSCAALSARERIRWTQRWGSPNESAPPGEDIMMRLIQLSAPMFHSPSPQKWQAQFSQSQQKKIPRVRTGRHRIPAER